MRITAAGNVGIGTSTPQYPLDVAGSIRAIGGGDPRLVLYNTSINGKNWSIYSETSGNLHIGRTGVADYIVIKDGGNVGIGTDSPSEKLEVDGNVQIGATTDAKLYMVSTGGNGNNERFFIEGYADGGTYGGGFKLSTRNDANVFNTAVTVNRNGNVGIGTTAQNAKLNVEQASAARITSLVGNNNPQGFAQNLRVVRHYPVVSVGTKLIIPFVAQGNLNSTTIVRIFGHSAKYNDGGALGFTADFTVGHLLTITATDTLSSTGNIASLAAVGSNLEITFTSGYANAVSDGVYVTIEYMTNNLYYSIDVPNITMN